MRRRRLSLRREALLFDEISSTAQRTTDIATRHAVEDLEASPDARDALVLSQPVRLRSRIVHGFVDQIRTVTAEPPE